MAHCYTVGIEVKGKQREICTLVPGNEDLAKDVAEAQRLGKPPRNPTTEEIDRALDAYFAQHPGGEPSDTAETSTRDTMLGRDRGREEY